MFEKASCSNELRPELSVPLVVDMDGTLVRSDLLYEAFFGALAKDPRDAVRAVSAISRGKPALKRELAQIADLDYGTLPYNEAVLQLIRQARSEGRPVILATAAARRHAEGVAEHLGLFDDVLSSDDSINLSAGRKADALVTIYGAGGYDYVGDTASDLQVWQHARVAYTVNVSAGVLGRLRAKGGEIVVVEPRRLDVRAWLKAIRVHQYAKNVLVFVPLLTSQSFTAAAITASIFAFVAFCMCASAVYIINDLMDLGADRSHTSKKRRPLARGGVRIADAVLLAPVLLAGSAIAALAVSVNLLLVVALYFSLTCAYSFYLKRRLLVDVVALSMLYTVRIFGGAIAISVVVSQWLLAFSLFLFTSLALMKRYVELAGRLDRSLPDPSDRNYRLDDLVIVAALAAATGVNAVLVLSLYVASPEVQASYARPEALWLMCPILLYWIGRALMMAHRRDMNDDPIVFAITDRNSRLALVCFLAIFGVASFG